MARVSRDLRHASPVEIAMSDKLSSLVLTVGGSPEPPARVIEAARPDRVVFIVSQAGDDVESSRPMVEAKRNRLEPAQRRAWPGSGASASNSCQPAGDRSSRRRSTAPVSGPV